MRVALAVMLVALAGCGGTSDVAHEALAEAERANSRISDLEYEIEQLKRAVNQLEIDRLNREIDSW